VTGQREKDLVEARAAQGERADRNPRAGQPGERGERTVARAVWSAVGGDPDREAGRIGFVARGRTKRLRKHPLGLRALSRVV